MAIQTTYSTAPAVAIAGLCADVSQVTRRMTAKNTDVVSIPFGAVVAFDTSSPTSEHDVNLPAASTAKLKGLVEYGNVFERTFQLIDGTTVGELDSTGLVVNSIFTIAQSGQFWVTCEDGCTAGDRLFVRFATSAGPVGTVGAARSTDAGSSTCIDATTVGQWMTTAVAGGLAKLQFDFTRKP